jgi:YfiH family protein
MSIMMLTPNWPAPANILAYTSLRALGNFAVDPLPLEAQRLHQVHGDRVIILDKSTPKAIPDADGSYTRLSQTPCAILTADCLPVLLCDKSGQEIAALHAGWRGLLANILARGVECFGCAPSDILVWLGPAIGPKVFEIGPEVYSAFVDAHLEHQQAFVPSSKPGHFFLDIYQLARLYLRRVGIRQIYGGEYCTYQDSERFFSYRRDAGQTGRMVTLISRQET